MKIDKTTVDYTVKLSQFHRQFVALGNNYNQTVKEIHSAYGQQRARYLLASLSKTSENLASLCEKIIKLSLEFKERISKIS